MFEMLMVMGFAYAGFCFLLPEKAVEDAEEEGDARRRRDRPAPREKRRPSLPRRKRKDEAAYRPAGPVARLPAR